MGEGIAVCAIFCSFLLSSSGTHSSMQDFLRSPQVSRSYIQDSQIDNAGKMASSKLAMSNWKQGQVTLFQALGISQSHVKLPTLTSDTIPSAVNNAETNPGGSGGGGGGGGIPNPGPSSGGDYTQNQLQQLWISAGGNPQSALIASAIAEAESSGRPDAIDNDSNGTQDQGLWQINSSHGLVNMFNPMANARAAIQISGNGTDWNPWTTYTSGAYRQFM